MTGRPYTKAQFFTVLPVVVLVAIYTVRGLAQEPTFSLKLDAALVAVDARVFDASGRPVTNLTQGDFKIYEDGEEQSLRSFASANSTCNILVLFDKWRGLIGPSGAQSYQELVLSPINQFLMVLRAQDRFAVANYEYHVAPSIVVPWQQVQPGMKATFRIPKGATPYADYLFGKDFYGALAWAAQQIRGIDGRKAIVVFSPGVDRSASPTTKFTRQDANPPVRLSPNLPGQDVTLLDPLFGLPDSAEESAFQSALKAMRQSGVPYYFVAPDPPYIDNLSAKTYFGDADDAPYFEIHQKTGSWERSKDMLGRVHARLQQAAGATGGRVYHPRAVEEVQAQAEEIAEDLRTFYSLAYRPPKPGGDGATHRIEVRVRDKSLRVIQSRDGYTANEPLPR